MQPRQEMRRHCEERSDEATSFKKSDVIARTPAKQLRSKNATSLRGAQRSSFVQKMRRHCEERSDEATF
jgi:hypothetical protein